MLSLAIGIGANTAIFTLVNSVMLRMLPVSHPEQLVSVAAVRGYGQTFTNPMWEAFRDQQHAFAHEFAYSQRRFDLATGGRARAGWGDHVSGDYFATLGVRPQLGRVLAPSDDRAGCAPIAVISDAWWRTALGRNPQVPGQSLTLNGKLFQVVGVLAPGFQGLNVGVPSGFFLPLCSEALVNPQYSALHQYSTWWLRVVGRPIPGVSAARLNAEVSRAGQLALANTVQSAWDHDRQQDYLHTGFAIAPAATGYSALRKNYGKALEVMMGVVALVLLIACANVANLQLGRATTRRAEVAIRVGLGASRLRVVRQLLTESVLLAALGAGLGVAIAAWLSRSLLAMMTLYGGSVVVDLSIDGRMLGFTALVACGTVILFGVAPAWRATAVDPQTVLRGGGRGVTPGRSRWSLSRALIIGQFALSVTLVAAATLFVGTFRGLVTLDPGFQRDHVVIAGMDLRYATDQSPRYPSLFDAVLARVRAIPGVEHAALAWTTPLDGSSQTDNIVFDGIVSAAADSEAYFDRITPGFFAALHIPLRAGRVLADADVAPVTRSAVVNQAFVAKFLGGHAVLGQSFRIGTVDPTPVTVVGVVGDTRTGSLRDAPVPMAYLPVQRDSTIGSGLSLVIESARPPAVIERAVSRGRCGSEPGHRVLVPVTVAATARHRIAGTVARATRCGAGAGGAPARGDRPVRIDVVRSRPTAQRDRGAHGTRCHRRLGAWHGVAGERPAGGDRYPRGRRGRRRGRASGGEPPLRDDAH